MQKIKRSLAALLCMLLMLTPFLAATPALTVEAARNSYINFSDLEDSYNSITKEHYYQLTAEAGQSFNIGDYISFNGSSKISKLSKVSKTATYKSSNKAIATISKKGAISAKQVGSTTISIKYKGKSLVCTLAVVHSQYSTNPVVADYKTSLDSAAKKFSKFSSIKASNCYTYINTLTALYVKNEAVQKATNCESNGLLVKETTTANGYLSDNIIVVANGTKFEVLTNMLNSYYSMNNPFNTSKKYSSQLKIKNTVATATGITLNLKSKVTQSQVFGALNRFDLSYLKNFNLDNTFSVYTPIYVYKMKQNSNGKYTRDYDYDFNSTYVSTSDTNTTFTGSTSRSYANFYTYLKAGDKTLSFAPGSASSYFDDDTMKLNSYSTASTYEAFTPGVYRAYVGGNSSFYVDFTVQ
ncbi:MAG: hypothetical protein ACERKZ_17285 [Lachnotalea sp.]